MKTISLLLVIGVFSLVCTGKSDHVTELPKDSVPEDTFLPDNCKQCIVITEQAQPAIVVVDVDQHKRVWEWNPYQAKDLQDPEWFAHPDEAVRVDWKGMPGMRKKVVLSDIITIFVKNPGRR